MGKTTKKSKQSHSRLKKKPGKVKVDSDAGKLAPYSQYLAPDEELQAWQRGVSIPCAADQSETTSSITL